MENVRIVIPGRPITKKNHSQIVKRGNRTFLIPSKQYIAYEKLCGIYIGGVLKQNINTPINLKCLYYMPTHHKVDLCNLLAATCDILTKYDVIEDDNSNIVISHDSSRVLYDKENPRVEIYIERIDDGTID